MFTPNFVLNEEYKSAEFTEDAINIHQEICKEYFRLYKNYSKTNNDSLRKSIIEWLKSHDTDTLKEILTIENNFTSKFVYHIIKLFIREKGVRIKIHKEKYSDFTIYKNNNEKSYYRDYNQQFYYGYDNYNRFNYNFNEQKNNMLEFEINSIIDQNIEIGNYNNNSSKPDEEIYEILFIKELQFISNIVLNDLLTISNEYVTNINKLIDLIDNFSNKKTFTLLPKCYEFCYPNKDQANNCSNMNSKPCNYNGKSQKYYNLLFCEWFDINEYNSFGKIISAIFEQLITVKFVIHSSKNSKFTYINPRTMVSNKLEYWFVCRGKVIEMLNKFKNELNDSDKVMDKVRINYY